MDSNRWSSARAKAARYARHRPEDSSLYRLVFHNRETLQYSWQDQFQAEYGALRNEVLAAFDKYLNCGILLHGCARAVCQECHHSELLAFSCKRRCLCSSCDAKRAVLFAEHLQNELLLPYPHSHQVYTIPKRLRPFFKFNRKLHSHLYQAAFGTWSDLIDDELPGCQTGAVMALHTAGDLLNFHPHVHSMMLHGATDQAGVFHPLDSINTEYLTKRFQHRILEALRKEQLIEQGVIDNMLAWEHSGFHVFVGQPIKHSDSDARLFVSRYLKKSPVSLKRMEIIETGSEPIVRYHKIKDNCAEHRDFTPLQFLAALSQHIPDRWEQTSRYFGVYSARTRGAKRLRAQSFTPLSEFQPAQKPSKSWAACIKRIFEVDPLLCPKCRGQMKIKAFILGQSEIERITKSIGIIPWRAPPPLATRNSDTLNFAA